MFPIEGYYKDDRGQASGHAGCRTLIKAWAGYPALLWQLTEVDGHDREARRDGGTDRGRARLGI